MAISRRSRGRSDQRHVWEQGAQTRQTTLPSACRNAPCGGCSGSHADPSVPGPLYSRERGASSRHWAKLCRRPPNEGDCRLPYDYCAVRSRVKSAERESNRRWKRPSRFAVMDCSLVRCATGRVCSNLRELLEAVRTRAGRGPGASHDALRPGGPFRTARVSQRLGPLVLDGPGRQRAGRTTGPGRPLPAAVDRGPAAALVNMIEDRLWGLDRVPWCRPGLELHLVESRLIAYDTGERIATPAALLEAIERHVAAVAVLPRPRSAAADGRADRRFLAVAGAERRRAVAGGDVCGQSTSTSST